MFIFFQNDPDPPPYSHPSGPCVSMKKMWKLHKKKIHKKCKQKKDQVAISSGGPQPEPKFMSLYIILEGMRHWSKCYAVCRVGSSISLDGLI